MINMTKFTGIGIGISINIVEDYSYVYVMHFYYDLHGKINKSPIRRSRIRENTKGRAYFMTRGRREFMDEYAPVTF